MFASSLQRRGFTLVEIMISVTILSVLLAIAVPNWIKSRERTWARTCAKQLTVIRAAKEQYAMTRNLGTATTISMSDLVTDGWLRPGIVCPTGSAYTVGTVNADPTCDSGLADHVVP